jgi:hypothetical protein
MLDSSEPKETALIVRPPKRGSAARQIHEVFRRGEALEQHIGPFLRQLPAPRHVRGPVVPGFDARRTCASIRSITALSPGRSRSSARSFMIVLKLARQPCGTCLPSQPSTRRYAMFKALLVIGRCECRAEGKRYLQAPASSMAAFTVSTACLDSGMTKSKASLCESTLRSFIFAAGTRQCGEGRPDP